MRLTPEQKLIELARMDGWKAPPTDEDGIQDLVLYKGPLEIGPSGCKAVCPPYLTSYDAIIPLVQKQDANTQDKIAMLILVDSEVDGNRDYLFQRMMMVPLKPAEQIANALLAAKGFEV